MKILHSVYNLTPQLEERINARWLVWHPWILMVARKRLPNVPIDVSLEAARTLHRARYVEILSHHIPVKTIKRQAIDDPRLDQVGFHIRIEEALRQRSFRMGRVKGVKRTHKQIKEAIRAKA